MDELHSLLDNLKESFRQIIRTEVISVFKEYQPPVIEPEELLTRQQTATLLGISIVTLYEWTKTGIIPAFRIGSRVRYRKSEVMESLKRVKKYRRNESQ